MFAVTNARILSGKTTRLVNIISDNGIITRLEDTGKRYSNSYNANGRLVFPGLIDSHIHLFGVGEMYEMIDLKGVRSIKEIKDKLDKTHSQIKNGWIIGRGWDQDKFSEHRFPSRQDLDNVTKKIPTMLVRVCGHIAVLNSAGLQRIKGIQRLKPEVVERDSKGNFTGIVKEDALSMCWNQIPSAPLSKMKDQFLLAQNDAIRHGIVAAHIILSDNWKRELAVIKYLDIRGRLHLKTSLLLPISAISKVEEWKDKCKQLNGNNFVMLGFKVYADGALGARTAALEYPYHDDRANEGILNYTTRELARFAIRTKKLGMILAIHAIGDRAINQVLRAFDLAKVKKQDEFRIEHCSVINKSILKKLSKTIVSIQPSFATSDYWVNERIGNDIYARRAHAFRSILKFAGKTIAGSDSPVESLDPLSGIRSAMNNPLSSERLSFIEAFDLYTVNAAGNSPITSHSGSIASGFTCDLVVLNTNSPKDFHKAKVKQVILNGSPIANI